MGYSNRAVDLMEFVSRKVCKKMKKTVRDIDVKGKKVIVRCDLMYLRIKGENHG